jgi:truncated hemoglobin YjbI
MMANRWMKKNPFMSMCLSGANAVANRARGHATAAAKQDGAAMAKETARVWMRAWLAAFMPKRRR